MTNIDAPDASWWYMAEQKQGPVATERLLQLLAAGHISCDTLVWRGGSVSASAWLPLRLAFEPYARSAGTEVRQSEAFA
jgi:hypothetical protein